MGKTVAMTQINETQLPGVGVRHDFETISGDKVGIISHHSGRREMVIYDDDDPDSVAETAYLTPEEARTFADLLGSTSIVEHFEDLRQQIQGLALDWLPIDATSRYAGRKLGDTELRAKTGVSIVALVRGDSAIASPGPEETLETDDVAVVVGTSEGIDAAAKLLAAGSA
ncbi:MAG: cation:proton antiporter regulatory subunit [Acidimicrobiia bacterium]